MYICYFDESGDDGYPEYSSQLFVLSSLYMAQKVWKRNFERIREFRRQLKNDFDLPIKREFHTAHFLSDKDPYHGKYRPVIRKEILIHFCEFIADLEVTSINVVIDKNKANTSSYSVLENALKYNVQRIENDMNYSDSPDKDFLIITDEGRVNSMRRVTRKIQHYNYIPSQYHKGSYRQEIEHLIEDPLPKPSDESWFIQLTDILATVVMLYARRNMVEQPIKWANRVRRVIDYGEELMLMNKLMPSFNTKASRENQFGVVCYPT